MIIQAGNVHGSASLFNLKETKIFFFIIIIIFYLFFIYLFFIFMNFNGKVTIQKGNERDKN